MPRVLYVNLRSIVSVDRDYVSAISTIGRSLFAWIG